LTETATTTDSERIAAIQRQLKAKDFADAENLVMQWLAEQPNNADALYFKAVVERAMGMLDRALSTLKTLLQQDPLYSRALQEQGHCYRQQNNREQAIHYYQQATKQNPSLIASWSALATLYRELGNTQAAEQAAAQVQQLHDTPPPLKVVMDLTARGKLAKAETLCKRFMQVNPKHTEGMRLLADIAQRMGALDEASLLLDNALLLRPDSAKLQIDRIQLARKCQHYEDAQQRAKQLLASDPNNPQFLSIAAVEAMHMGDYETAVRHFDRVLAKLPEDVITLTGKGHALKTLGDVDSAIACYKAALSAAPQYGEAWHALANLKTYRFSADERQQMLELHGLETLEHNSRIFIEFALGKAFEDMGDYAHSFSYYALGNEHKHRQSLYNAERMHEDLQGQIDTCTPALFAQFAGAGCRAPDPIFIVGLPRAGSTLLEQILSSHSMVDGTLELPNVLSLAQRLRRYSENVGYPEVLSELTADDYRAFGEAYIEDTRVHRQGAPYFIDKMPNNFRHIGLIKLMLPNAKIIDARRHPLACCFSGFKQLFAEGQEFSYDLNDLGRYYRDYVMLMDHWQSVLPGDVLTVNNEDVIADLEGQVRRILDFCALPFEAACLRYWETDRAVKTPSSEQVRRPVSDSGQHQWQHYDPWLGPLRAALGEELVTQSEKYGI